MDSTGEKAIIFFKDPKHRFFCLHPFILGSRDRRWCELESPESLEWEALGETWGMAAGIPVPAHTSVPQQPLFLRRASPSQGKNNYTTRWETTCPTLWNLALPNSHLYFSSFPPPCILTPAEETATLTGRLRGCQRLALGCGHFIHIPRNQTGAPHPSQESHRNIFLVSGRPKLWASEAPPTFLVGALLCLAELREISQDGLRHVAQGWGNTQTVFPEV